MKEITIDGKLHRQVKTSFIYVSTDNRTHCQSLVGRGANGGVSCDVVTDINTPPHRYVKIRAIDNNFITSVSMATVGDLDHSKSFPVTIIMHQYEYHGGEKTIHSSVQIEWYKNDVNEKPGELNAREQFIITHWGYIYPLRFL